MKNDKFHLLIVEDKMAYHAVYETEINDVFDCEISFAIDGEEALSILSSTESLVDMMLLDLNIPKLSGYEVLKFVRKQPKLQSIPVIILTGDSDDETQIRLLQAGATDFIVKGGHPEILTSRIATHMKTAQAMERLEQTVLETDMFSAGVLHDIRNLEASLLALCEIIEIKLEPAPEEIREIVTPDVVSLKNRVSQIGKYANEIIQSVRNKQKDPIIEAVSILEIATWAADSLNTPGDPNSIELEVDQAIEPVGVQADRNFLKMAVFNLIQNAQKYQRPDVPPKVSFSQRLVETDDSHKRVITYLRDNGKGLKKGELRKVFNPFTRGSSISSGKGGFGLGLSMVSRIVGKMDGKVWAELPEDSKEPGLIIAIELPASE